MPVSTNAVGNLTTEVAVSGTGSHTLSVTAIDSVGQSTTEAVMFEIGSAEVPPPVEIARAGSEIVVNYVGDRLQGSMDLSNWNDVHTAQDGSGAEYRDSGLEQYRFFRAVRD